MDEAKRDPVRSWPIKARHDLATARKLAGGSHVGFPRSEMKSLELRMALRCIRSLLYAALLFVATGWAASGDEAGENRSAKRQLAAVYAQLDDAYEHRDIEAVTALIAPTFSDEVERRDRAQTRRALASMFADVTDLSVRSRIRGRIPTTGDEVPVRVVREFRFT